MSRRLTSAAAALALAVAVAAMPPPVAAHPLGNYTVNRAVAVEIGAALEVRYVVDMAEIPAFETIQRIDADGDGAVGGAEGATFARESCAAIRSALAITVDGDPADLRDAVSPTLDFPEGVGGLPTLRMDCRFAFGPPAPDPDVEHELTVRDLTDDARIGWREVTAGVRGGARILATDVPEESPSDLLTAYPEDRLEAPSDVSTGTVRFRLAPEQADASPATTSSAAARPSDTATDPLATLIGGDLSPAVVVLAILFSLGLGALHALSPGHGKTLVAGYVLGAGGTPRSAAFIGLSVAVSHTAGVFVLGVVTLLASQFILPERVIAWLSLGSGVIVTGLGAVLLMRAVLRRPGRSAHRHDASEEHGQPHPHPHHHDPVHRSAPPGGLSARSALALGFAGGAVPSASAVIVLLVAIGTDRLLLGMVLIAAFGIGMAAVLGGLALMVARIGLAAQRSRGWLSSPPARRAAALVPAAAGVAVLATGLAFSLAAVAQLA